MADSMNTVERQSKRRRCDSEGKGGSRGRGARGRGDNGRGMGRGHGSAGSVSKDNPFYTKFNSYSQQYDESQDRRERLVKISRDITILSKRLIFLLHRSAVGGLDTTQFEEADEKLQEIHTKLTAISKELEGHDAYKYLRAFTPGMEEYIEGLSFFHYLKYRELLTFADIASYMKASDTMLSFAIPMDAYIGGIGDLTGELMRMCINGVVAGNFDLCKSLCDFVRAIYQELQMMSLPRNFNNKMRVMGQSLVKMEKALYNMHVRGAEYPKERLLDLIAEDDS